MPATEPARPMGGAADGNGMAPVGDVASLDTVVRSKKIPEVLFKNFRGKIFGNHIYTLSAACPADSFRTVVRSRPTGLTHRYPPPPRRGLLRDPAVDIPTCEDQKFRNVVQLPFASASASRSSGKLAKKSNPVLRSISSTETAYRS